VRRKIIVKQFAGTLGLYSYFG